jgi:hypothetical protein
MTAARLGICHGWSEVPRQRARKVRAAGEGVGAALRSSSKKLAVATTMFATPER